MGNNVEEEFRKLFDQATKIGVHVRATPSIPGVVRTQVHWGNYPSNTPGAKVFIKNITEELCLYCIWMSYTLINPTILNPQKHD